MARRGNELAAPPAHPNHPLQAAAVNDAAVWVCPQNREVVDQIGEV